MNRRPLLRAAGAAAAVALAICTTPTARAGDGPIQDNSFLIEEAYNQEPGVIQHINAFARSRGGGWVYSFTEEWPVLGQRNQASVTFTALKPESLSSGIGDLALNYRLQAVGSGDTRVALAPRLSVIVPTGDADGQLGSGSVGVQVNVPLSAVLLPDALVTHVNVGGTYFPESRVAPSQHASSTTFAGGGSLIWLAHPKFNVMLEALYTNTGISLPGGTEHVETFTLNPGIRGAIDFSSGLQIVPGIAFPIGVGPTSGERAVFLYLSFEHPCRLAGPTEKS